MPYTLQADGTPVDPAQLLRGEYDRHEQRRGRRHAYERLTPATTCLVVVDMVPLVPVGPDVVATVARLAADVRRSGALVAWVVPRDAEPTTWAREFYGGHVAERYAAGGSSGTLLPGLSPGGHDLVVEKSASSAFFPGRCDLPDLLRLRGVDSVVLCGAVTHVCVESSARDAATLGFRTVVASDACHGLDDLSHWSSLRAIYRSFGDVRTGREIEGLLRSDA